MKKLLIVLLVFTMLAGSGCEQRSSANSGKFSGTLELTEHSLGAKAAGRVTTLSVQEGEEVKKGQLLATLDRFEQAQKDYERIARLVKEGGAAQQSLEYAALALDDQQVVSPIDGVVLVKVHEVGETVSAGVPLVVIGDRSELWVRIYVPQSEINNIYQNQPAKLFFDGVNDTFPGHVSFIAPYAEFTPRNVQTKEERITQTFAVKVTLDHPPSYLRPGVAADVAIDFIPR